MSKPSSSTPTPPPQPPAKQNRYLCTGFNSSCGTTRDTPQALQAHLQNVHWLEGDQLADALKKGTPDW